MARVGVSGASGQSIRSHSFDSCLNAVSERNARAFLRADRPVPGDGGSVIGGQPGDVETASHHGKAVSCPLGTLALAK